MHKYILTILLLITSYVWLSVISYKSNILIVACDVGQGDAILIQHKDDQILIDGGPDNKVLDCLGRYMPFWDRRIELVVLTHPDSDHISGLLDVFDRYEVDTFFTNDMTKPVFGGELVELLESKVGGGTKYLQPTTSNQHLRLGLIYLDILHPYETFEDSKSNNYSIVSLLRYGNFEALFTGDIENRISDKLSVVSSIQNIEYIKVPHHGSKNGLSQKLLDTTKPEVAVISVGKNSYGHPHSEVIKLLSERNIKILRTDEEGDVKVETDGEKFRTKD